MAAIWPPCDPIERDILAEREDEQIEIEVQSRILHSRDIDLADLVLDGDELPASVELAARRLLGAVIRKALGKSRATLTDDEQRMTDYIREVFESELRGRHRSPPPVAFAIAHEASKNLRAELERACGRNHDRQ